MIQSTIALLLCAPCADTVAAAQPTKDATEPELHSLVPIGAARDARHCRSASRGYNAPDDGIITLGFRVVLIPSAAGGESQ